MRIRAVVASYYAQSLPLYHAVAQECYSCLVEEVLCIRCSCQIFVIAETRHHGGVKSSELLRNAFVVKRFRAIVYNIAGNEYQVGMLRVNHIHPPCYFRPAVVVPGMQVAHHHYL